MSLGSTTWAIRRVSRRVNCHLRITGKGLNQLDVVQSFEKIRGRDQGSFVMTVGIIGRLAVDKIVKGDPAGYKPAILVRIVLEILRCEDSIAEFCRREGIAASMYYGWSKEFLAPGRRPKPPRPACRRHVRVLAW
jgi:hypothetical protein